MLTDGLSVHRIDNDADFADLKDAWNSLVETTESRSVFLRHEWFESAWQWARTDSALDILCFRKGTELVGIVPLVRRASKVNGIRVRALAFLAVPDTQLADLIVAPHNLGRLCKALAAHLREQRSGWDSLTIPKLPQGSETVDTLRRELADAGCAPSITPAGANLYLRLDEPWEQYYGRRSRRLKKGNNSVRNRLTAQFDKIEIVQVDASIEDIEPPMADIVAISSRSWKASTGTTLDRDGPGAFVRTLTRHAAQQGWLLTFVLYLDGRPAAMEYQLAYSGDVYALRADFDTTLDRWSPGTYLGFELLKSLFSTGRARYLMGPGANAYKLRWAEASEQLVELQAFSPSAKGRLLAAAKRLVATAGAIRDRLRSLSQPEGMQR